MENGYILLIPDPDISKVPHEHLKEMIKAIECLSICGKNIYISPETSKKLVNWISILKEMQEDEQHRNPTKELFTGPADKLALLIQKARPLRETGDIFSLNYNGTGTHLVHIGGYVPDNFIPKFVTFPNHTDPTISKHLIVAYDNDRIELITGDNHFKTSLEIQKHLGEGRTYHYSEKHGDDTHKCWKGQSQLRCSGERAQELLDIALHPKDSNRCAWQWDEIEGSFIKFFYEGNNPQKQWHCFHIKDPKEERKIPTKVRKYFDH